MAESHNEGYVRASNAWLAGVIQGVVWGAILASVVWGIAT